MKLSTCKKLRKSGSSYYFLVLYLLDTNAIFSKILLRQEVKVSHFFTIIVCVNTKALRITKTETYVRSGVHKTSEESRFESTR